LGGSLKAFAFNAEERLEGEESRSTGKKHQKGVSQEKDETDFGGGRTNKNRGLSFDPENVVPPQWRVGGEESYPMSWFGRRW